MAHCKVVYETDENGVKYAARCILPERASLFEIKATYAKQLKPATYYLAAESKGQAKRIFVQRFPWLSKIDSVRKIESEREKEEILTDINRMPLWS